MADAARPDRVTFCLGRFLIDIPAGSALLGGGCRYNFARIETPAPLGQAQFRSALEALANRPDLVPREASPSAPASPETAQACQVLAFRADAPGVDGLRIEGHRWIEGIHFALHAEADPDKLEQAVARMHDRLRRLRPRQDAEIPAEPGYCFGGGFIADGEWKNEEAGVDITLAGHPDTVLSIDFFPLDARNRGPSLPERVGGVLRGLGKLLTGVKVLRRGARRLGPFAGDEYLVTVPDGGTRRAHSFLWETQGGGTLETPFVRIEFSTGRADRDGNPQPVTLTNAEAVELWDRIVESFRLRPVPRERTDATGAATSQARMRAS